MSGFGFKERKPYPSNFIQPGCLLLQKDYAKVPQSFYIIKPLAMDLRDNTITGKVGSCITRVLTFKTLYLAGPSGN